MVDFIPFQTDTAWRFHMHPEDLLQLDVIFPQSRPYRTYIYQFDLDTHLCESTWYSTFIIQSLYFTLIGRIIFLE